MRVLIASQEMPPETGWGGVGTYVATLGTALAAEGAEVHVLSVVRHQQPSDNERDGVIVHRRHLRRLPGIGRLTGWEESWERFSLALAVRREADNLDFEPDVVEAPEWRAEGLGIGLGRRLPLVVRLHSSADQLFPFVARSARDARAAIALERAGIARADLVVSTRANLAALGASGQRIRASRAVPLPVPKMEPELNAPAAPQITFVGRLERVKGPEILVRAAKEVLAKVPQARFTFIGADTGRAPGSYLERLNALAASLGVASAVEFVGHRPHAEVIDALRGSNVCVFPSRQETFGYGAAEAAGLARPVVASRIGSFVELFGDDGAARLVAVDDVQAWASAIVELLRSPHLARQVGMAGRERIHERCAPERVAGQMLEVYQEAIERHRARGSRRASELGLASGRRLYSRIRSAKW
jgi:glycogen(starch) synthase